MADEKSTEVQQESQGEPAKKSDNRPFVLLEVTCDCGTYEWVRMAPMRKGGGIKCRDCHKRLKEDRYVEKWRFGAKTPEEAIAKASGEIPVRRKFRRGSHEKHGLCKTREYGAWADMITRCTNPNFNKYKYYGGKGITVCLGWLQSFLAFLADMGICPAGRSVDRIDSTKGYWCGHCEDCVARGVDKCNCRWATQAEQMRNTSRTRLYTIGDKTQCVTDWASDGGVTASAVYSRLRAGASIEEAISKEYAPPNHDMITFAGKTQNRAAWDRARGFPKGTIGRRQAMGWDNEKCITTPLRKKAKNGHTNDRTDGDDSCSDRPKPQV